MSRSTAPNFREILVVQLTAKARSRWRRSYERLDQMLNLVCQARAMLAQSLGLTLDPDGDGFACCTDGVPTEPVTLDEAARKALGLLALAISESLIAEDLLSEFNEATAQHIELISRKR